MSYLNTKPLLYGIMQGSEIKNMSLVQEYPSKIAAMLLNDEIDVGLVPVVIIPKMSESYIFNLRSLHYSI